ncbi:MAG: HAD family hydrolase, partial [Pirellulales bacterium]
SQVRAHVGRGLVHLLEQTIPQRFRDDPVAMERNVARYRTHHPSVMREQTRLLAGARDALSRLHERGLRIAVCSNKPAQFTRELLAHFELADKVDVVLGPEDVARPKPAPQMLQTALERLGVAAGEALYVGDMTVDVEAARAAGVRVWIVPTGAQDRPTLAAAGPDRVLDSLEELPALIGSP